MNGCATCGGFGDRHDPIAHGTERETERDPLRVAISAAIWSQMPDQPYRDDADECADAVLALPEIAELRAKAAAADRVRQEVEAWGDACREWYYAHRHDAGGTTYACGFEDGWNHAEECAQRVLGGNQ